MTSDHVQQRIVLLLTDAHSAARAGHWDVVRATTEQVLHLNPFNHEARAYWSLARNGGTALDEPLGVQVAKHLDAVKIAAAVQDWQEVIAESEKLLQLDPENADALAYLQAANDALRGRVTQERTKKGKAASGDRAPQYLYADSSFISKALCGLLAGLSLLYLLAAGLYFYGAGLVDKVDRGEASVGDAEGFDRIATIAASVLAFGFAAAVVLLLVWVYRESINARALGLQTLASPPIAVLACLAGTLGGYVILRDLLHTLRGSLSLLSEALIAAWLLAATAGAGLSIASIKHPADNGEWASLLLLTSYGSLLLGVAGLSLALSLRQAHQDLVARYLRPNRPQRSDTASASIAA